MITPAQDLLWMGVFGQDASAVEGPRPGGIILFARNLDPDPALGPARCHALLRDLQARWGAERPLAVALDQEGGPVSRLRVWTGPTPALRQIWLQGGPAACEAWGRLWGRGLALLGFNVDFAPVCDCWDGHPGTGLGDRCASADPLEVARAAGAFLHGLEGQGVRGCLKHFPGLGGTHVDSHRGLPELADPAQVLRNLQAFRPLAQADRLIMVAHLRTPWTDGLPASLHCGSVAQNPWDIQGRWLPDDLEMGGCAEWSWEDRVRLCLEAGHHALLVCQTPEGVAACAEAARGLPEALVASARPRFLSLRETLRPAASGPFPRPAWENWLEDLRRESARILEVS